MEERKPDCFILGSGSSLLQLSPEERSYLNAHPRVLAFNKYLLFWDELGIIPTDYLLGVRNFSAILVFVRSLNIARQLRKPVNIYLDRFYAQYFMKGGGWLNLVRGLRHRLIVFKHHKFWIPLNIIGFKANFFHYIWENWENRPFHWATNLGEPLFASPSGLTLAINLASIIYPGCNIKLLGVDLNTNEYFFGAGLKNHPELLDWSFFIQNKEKKHPSLLTDKPYLLNSLKIIASHLNFLDRGFFCCNEKSLLITENICQYRPVIE
jgi:hypothetical protein